MKPCLVDVNVWIALAHDGHTHHLKARQWFERLDSVEAFFCRVTQVAFLRLLTNNRIAEACGTAPCTLIEAWRGYDAFREDPRVGFLPEPQNLDQEFRLLSQGPFPSPNLLPDAYLAAFANTWEISLATFDHGFATRGGVRDLVIIE